MINLGWGLVMVPFSSSANQRIEKTALRSSRTQLSATNKGTLMFASAFNSRVAYYSLGHL
jgi:hypothetical protein